jgi:hypothetical protein
MERPAAVPETVRLVVVSSSGAQIRFHSVLHAHTRPTVRRADALSAVFAVLVLMAQSAEPMLIAARVAVTAMAPAVNQHTTKNVLQMQTAPPTNAISRTDSVQQRLVLAKQTARDKSSSSVTMVDVNAPIKQFSTKEHASVQTLSRLSTLPLVFAKHPSLRLPPVLAAAILRSVSILNARRSP